MRDGDRAVPRGFLINVALFRGLAARPRGDMDNRHARRAGELSIGR
jgi:hypothetical protein